MFLWQAAVGLRLVCVDEYGHASYTRTVP